LQVSCRNNLPEDDQRTHNVTGDEFTSFNFDLLTIANDLSLHSDVTLQAGNDVGSLLFLVPTDNGVEHQNADNDTEIDPITQTSSEKDSKLHDCGSLAGDARKRTGGTIP
jgi:hypothetical protein